MLCAVKGIMQCYDCPMETAGTASIEDLLGVMRTVQQIADSLTIQGSMNESTADAVSALTEAVARLGDRISALEERMDKG